MSDTLKYELNEANKTAKGGSEIMLEKLYNSLPSDLLSNFQIIPSRAREFDKEKVRVMWIQDLSSDTNEYGWLANGGWKKVHKFVFVSNWQQQNFINQYGIHWSHCVVIENAIKPISWTFDDKMSDKIKFVFHPVPYKGLDILIPVFVELLKKHKNIELDVFSSFKLYGHDARDKPYEHLIEICKNTDGINYYGTVSNDDIREALKKAHVFGYPNVFPETSSISLIEAMSAGLICVHPNYGALYETAGKFTEMYPWHENPNVHAHVFYQIMDNIIQNFNINDSRYKSKILSSKNFIDIFHNWDYRACQWGDFLNSIKDLPRDMPKGDDYLVINT